MHHPDLRQAVSLFQQKGLLARRLAASHSIAKPDQIG
jgi:hypothetical protein